MFYSTTSPRTKTPSATDLMGYARSWVFSAPPHSPAGVTVPYTSLNCSRQDRTSRPSLGRRPVQPSHHSLGKGGAEDASVTCAEHATQNERPCCSFFRSRCLRLRLACWCPSPRLGLLQLRPQLVAEVVVHVVVIPVILKSQSPWNLRTRNGNFVEKKRSEGEMGVCIHRGRRWGCERSCVAFTSPV